MSIEILNYKPVNKGFLIGTCDIKMLQWGNFIISPITVFEKNGQRWFTFPSREYEKEGQKKWFQHCKFETEQMSEAFRKHFFLALDKHLSKENPSVFEKTTPIKQPSERQITPPIQPNQTESERIEEMGEPPF